MKAYGVERKYHCCPGHNCDSKKFDRANRHRRINSLSRKNYLRSFKKAERRDSKNLLLLMD